MSTSPVGGDAFQTLNGQHATLLLNPWFSKVFKGVCKGMVMGEDLDKEKGGAFWTERNG